MSPIDEAARNARAGQELLQASGDVIARRLEIVADAIRDPFTADYRELTLMGSEKVEALAASASAGMSGAMAVADRASRVAARESAAARGALDAVMASKTPMEAMTAQSMWAANAWTRSMREGWAMSAALMKLQADTLKPIHAAATANARRLKR